MYKMSSYDLANLLTVGREAVSKFVKLDRLLCIKTLTECEVITILRTK